MLTSLPILTIEAHSRCNCRCGMCDIWRSPENRSFTPEQLTAHLDSIDRLGTKHVVFTGGEPLMNPHLFELSGILRQRGIRVTLLSTGLLLERFAANILASFDEIIVSLDGPSEIHDRIRGVPGAFASLARGIYSLRGMPVSARCVVQRRNCAALLQTADSAEALGLRSISFLAADVTTSAFGRKEAWPLLRQDDVCLTGSQLPELESQIAQLADHPLVADSPTHLARIVQLFRAHLGLEVPHPPRCNAPFVSAYLRLDASVQPCFFHQSYPPGHDLFSVLNSPEATGFRNALDSAANPICRRCVCSLHLS